MKSVKYYTLFAVLTHNFDSKVYKILKFSELAQ